jgi:ADP-dependent phosphofructokinase/glucokinase
MTCASKKQAKEISLNVLIFPEQHLPKLQKRVKTGAFEGFEGGVHGVFTFWGGLRFRLDGHQFRASRLPTFRETSSRVRALRRL